MKTKILEWKKNPGSHLEEPIFTQIGLDWLCYLAGNFWMAPRIFFCFNVLIFIYFFKYKTIETHARAFLPLNISAVGSVSRQDKCPTMVMEL